MNTPASPLKTAAITKPMFTESPTILDTIAGHIASITAIAAGVSGACVAAWKYCFKPARAWHARRKILFENVERIAYELKPNGGSSLKDQINRIEVLCMTEPLARRFIMDDSLAFWESDAEGSCIHASEKLAKLVGRSQADILGNGWVATLKASDKRRIFTAWKEAVEQKRAFIETYTFVHDNGREITVRAESKPVIVHGEVRGWLGVLREVEESQ